MVYRIFTTKAALREFNKLERALQEAVRDCILPLESNPRPDGVTKLKGQDNSYRVTEGDYRIVFDIDDKQRLVTIVRIGRRDKVYKKK